MKTTKALTKNSFELSGRGFVIELKHSLNGLKEGIVLISESSKLKWKIVVRILFDHAVHEQITFKCESVENSFSSFTNVEKRNKSIQDIVDRENQGIFQYMIEPIGHINKPEDGEVLIITDNDK